MNVITRKLSWPLLGKELVEQAARKRTYLIRVVYAAVLIGVFLFNLQPETPNGPGVVLGHGWTLFKIILVCQCVGVLLFLPAMMAGVIASEKERGSLELLFLTDLKPWEMIWQKYLGRLIPMLTFLLISLPLLAVAYAFGGVSSGQLIDGILMLFLTCLQLGAFSLMCSAFCRTTTGAVLASYLWGAVFYFIVPFLFLIIHPRLLSRADEKLLFILCPPMEYFSSFQYPLSNADSPEVILAALATTGLFLLGARIFLTRRAFVAPRNILLGWFKKLDRFFTIQNRLIGGIVFFAKPDSLPDDQPVAWRELERRSLGQWNYLIRIFVVLEAATFFLCLTHWNEVFQIVLWVTAALALSVQAVNVITKERTNQTLETLLTTSLTGRDILQQKMRGLYRLMLVFAIPLLTIIGVAIWANSGQVQGLLVTSFILSVIIFLPMITWVSLWISLKCQKRNQAILIVLGVLAAWCVGPPMVFWTLESMYPNDTAYRLILLLSPAAVVALSLLNEWAGFCDSQNPILMLILTFGFYAGVLYIARVACLRRADRYLRGEATPAK